jgi:RND family efflux transporter MFP subunit
MDLVAVEAESTTGNAASGGSSGSLSSTPSTRSTQVRIDPVVVQNMGVRTVTVESRALVKEIRTTGKVAIDETRQVSINAKVMGWVEKLRADFLGKQVRKGEVLMEVYSPEWVSTQEEFLQALSLRAALSPHSGDHAVSSAQQLVESARRRLEFWDIPTSAIDAVAREGKARRTLPLLAPASGTLVAKNIVEGQSFAPGTELLRLADLSRVWVLGEVAQSDLPFVALGQEAEVSVAYHSGPPLKGLVSFIAPVTDARAKTTWVRVILENDSARTLKPEMVADVALQRPMENTLTVPEQAVLRTGRRTLVVAALGQGVFEPREVKLGATAQGYTQVLEGLQEGELAVLSAQFLIDSESNLKAAILRMGAAQALEESSPEGHGHEGGAP